MKNNYIERMSINLRPPICGSGEKWEEMIPMRDGVKLRTVFQMPDTEGPWPVIFSRTPYPKNQEIYDYQGKIFAERGYGFIYQYCRGTGQSEGEWRPFENEKQDGEDTLKWLEEQDYIKNIGMYGYSYVGYTQWVLMDCLTPKVKTAYIVHFGTDRYRQMYCNGLFRHDIYTPWAKDNNGMGRKLPYEAAVEAGRYKPHIEADRAVWNMDLPWYREWISHTDYNHPYWKESFWEDLKQMPGKANIPLCLGCGWYDHHFGGMMEAYEALSPEAKSHTRLVIGPWVHNKTGCIAKDDMKTPFESGIHGYEGALCWMDKCLNDGPLPEKEVIVYGAGQGWRKLAQWPGKSAARRMYFAEGVLKEGPEAEEHTLMYTYDPQHVIKTRGAECMCYAPIEYRGSILQEEPEKREDQLVLISAPMKGECCLNGTVKVHLHVSTDVEDTAFIVRLMEITPDGKTYNIRTSATTLKYRNGAEEALDYIPGERVECELKMWDILWNLQKGSRIRMEIASSSFPEYHIHCNTAEPWELQKTPVIANQSIYTGGDNGSHIELPIEENE